MSFILSAYSADAFKEYNLPSINNSDYEFVIRHNRLSVKDDINVLMEVIDDRWTLKSGPNYRLFVEKNRYDSVEIEDGLIISLVTDSGETINMIASEVASPFHAFEKYRLSGDSEVSFGRDPSNDVTFKFTGVGRNHASIKREGRSTYITNHSKNGIYINSVRVDGSQELQFGDYINIIGLHLVYLGPLLAIDTGKTTVQIKGDKLKRVSTSSKQEERDESLKALSEGKKTYKRSPRYVESIEKRSIEIEAADAMPKDDARSVFVSAVPSITMALPMLLGLILMIYSYLAKSGGGANEGFANAAMYLGLALSVISAIGGIVWTLATGSRKHRETGRLTAQRQARYKEYLDAKKAEISEAYEKTLEGLRDNYPSAESYLSLSDSSSELWNRNSSHEDFLVHRIGSGDIPFQTEIVIPKKTDLIEEDALSDEPANIKDYFSTLRDAPVTVNLLKHSIIGLVGGDKRRGAINIARTLSADIAACNCYTDVKLAYVYDASKAYEEGEWDFAAWLPHVWSEDKKTRYVASNAAEASDMLYELGNVFRARSEEDSHKGAHYVLFIAEPSLVQDNLFSKYIYDEGGNLGLTTIFLAEQYGELPNKCDFIIEDSEGFSGYYHTSGRGGSVENITFDNVGADALDEFARRLSGLEVSDAETSGDIPSSLSFFEMMDIRRPEDLPIREHWTKNRVYENIRGMLGFKAGGLPVSLDLHERYHGPHGLVAGTTGSGKSETLQTFLLSLAVNYSPDDIAFFIIDYKGGGMAGLFEGMPHLAGQITNLSGNQVNRAMISIKSENRRRQRIFAESGVNNINSYTLMYKNGEVKESIPHLLIVVDEFAELKREAPEFMDELISVAQVGRSLGVHLILATQKPCGTVDDNIRSNSRFRLCLRVQDKQDSIDVLQKPDAAYITQAGRCYLQVGSDELFELFQSAYSGALYDEHAGSVKKDVAAMIGLTGKTEMTGSSAVQKLRPAKSGSVTTEFDAVKTHLAKISKESGYKSSHQLWLPVLSDRIYLDELKLPAEKDWNLKAVIGRVDDPENQRQKTFSLDFADCGNLAICGNIVSGKSTLLQTITYSLLKQHSPEIVNVYVLDFSSKMMSAFEDAPHVGGIMYEGDDDKIAKFFNMIKQMLEERKKVLHGGNYRQYIKANGACMPAVFVMIDNYAVFRQRTEEAYEEDLLMLSKEGVSNGIYLIVSGGGFNTKEIPPRMADNFNTVLTLSLKDKYEYGELLHSNQINMVPEQGIRGRGLAYCDGRILEYQTALALKAGNDYERIGAIKQQMIEMSDAWDGKRARPVPMIPKKALWSDFVKLDDYKEQAASVELLPIGYDASNAAVYGIPLRETFCYGIYGDMQSGKTNMLKACILSAKDKNADIYVIDSEEGSLSMFSGAAGIHYVKDESEVHEMFKGLIPEFQRRRDRADGLNAEGMEADELFDVMSSEFKPVFIFIAELDSFIQRVYKSEFKMDGFLENVMRKGRGNNIFFFGDVAVKNRSLMLGYPAFEAFAGHRSGIHLGGKLRSNGILDFEYIPYSEQNRVEKAGVGTLPDAGDDGVTSKIVIPLVKQQRAKEDK